MSFRIRLFLSFILYGAAIVSLSYLFLFKTLEEDVHQNLLERANAYAYELDHELSEYLQHTQGVLRAISTSEIFLKNYKQKNTEALTTYFYDMASTSTNIIQLRFLDLSGEEIVRVDKESKEALLKIVQQKDLQNKAQRYYFREILKLNKGEFWISRLDLNIEHGKIQKPYLPVLRIGTPAYVEGKRVGIIIANLYMNDYLKEIAQTRLYNAFLIDKEGNIISEPGREICFSKYIESPHQHHYIFLKYMDEINKNKLFVGEEFVALHVNLLNEDGLHLIVMPNETYVAQRTQRLYKGLAYFIVLAFFASLTLAYFLSLFPSQLKSKVDRLNAQLQKDAKDRELLLSLFDLGESVLFKWNNDEGWSVAYVSKSVERLTGYTKEEFENSQVRFSECVHPEDLGRVVQEVTNAVKENEDYFKHEPYRLITKEGDEKWILDHTIIVRNEKDEIEYYIGYLSDITELKEKEIELKRVARTDQLTQIYNRLFLDEVLYSQHYRFNRYNEQCSLVLLDIDYFKDVNDRYGHLAGDTVLKEFAQILKSSVRSDDIVGRWGGEEFLIVLPHTDVESALVFAQKLQSAIREYQFTLVGHKTASMGVAQLMKGQTVEQWVDAADEALYEAKKEGRDCIVVHV